jgi:magnesium-protoporphyrin IX monomethyl ester (oxidative) cyclase
LGVLGEGEETMLELMRIYEKYGEFKKDSLKKVKGVVFNENGRFHITERRPFIEPLDKIPYPARDLLNMDFYLKPSRMVPDKISIGTTMMTSRGCPYSCVYCASPQFWRKKTRFHSAKYVFGEMKFLEEKYKVKTIRIWDDLFTVNTKRLRELVDLIRSDGLHEKIEFYCYGRANLMTEDICKLIKKMNVKYISFGFESNSERVLNYLKRGTVTVKQNENALKLCKKYGFVTDGTFIFGTPGETKEDMEKTFDLIKNENLDRALAFTLTPFPGTEIWEYAKSIGVLKNENEIDWQKIDLRKFSENIYMNKAMTKQEFLKEFDTIQKYISEVKNTSIPQIELKYLFNPHFIRRFLSNWRGFSNEFINGVKIKLSHTKK